MTCAARRLGARVRRISVFDHAPLDLEPTRPQLGGRESLIVAQVSNDRACRGGIELDAVQRDHATHGHLPPFGSLALERNALEHARRVALMAALTARARVDVVDDEALRSVGGRPAAGAATTSGSASATLRLDDTSPDNKSNDEPNAR